MYAWILRAPSISTAAEREMFPHFPHLVSPAESKGTFMFMSVLRGAARVLTHYYTLQMVDWESL